MLYDIVNPSDSYTIRADDLKIAAAACVLLGRGQYAFDPLEKGGKRVPLMLFGGMDKWFMDHFDQDADAALTDVIENRAAELADCLDSCVIGKIHDRRDHEAALSLIESPEERDKFRAERHDRRRSSLNDIGGRAYEMAKNLRAKVVDPVLPAPQ